MYHIDISGNDIGNTKTVIMPGDPARVEKIAKQLDKDSIHLTSNREYTSYLSAVGDKNILTCSTGIGCPSTAIAIEELASIGIKNFIRIGTTGAIQENISIGDIIISNASVRLDGTSTHYAPIEYPAVADHYLTHYLVDSANKRKIDFHLGITASSDTFYCGQERYDSYSGYVIKRFQGTMNEWKKLNVLNYEMESSALFVVCNALKLKSSALYAVIANRNESERTDLDSYNEAMSNCIEIVKNSILDNNEL
jgi:uridine phosphorylase